MLTLEITAEWLSGIGKPDFLPSRRYHVTACVELRSIGG